MTHGDKAKAKTGKNGQASAKKVSSKVVAQTSGQSGQADKTAGKSDAKKQQGAGEKAAPASKKGGGSVKAVPLSAASDAKGKSRASASAAPPSSGDGSGFSNAVVGAAFKRALKKYPNALRKLTD